MMLDVLFKIKDEMDHTVNFRRSCRFAHLRRRGQPCIWDAFPVHCCPAPAAAAVHIHRSQSTDNEVLMPQGGHLRQLRHEH